MARMRLGLIGTGYWAREVHASGAARQPEVELVGVWGRDRARTARMAADFHMRAYADPNELIEDVEALTFAVPPTVQAEIGVRAARRGRHLLLEKPIALSVAAAQALERAITEAHVASLVFYTQRFVPETQTWLQHAAETGGWVSGRVEIASNIFVAGGPFASSEWRREYGALWDIGPHVLSLLWPVLGEVAAVVAGRGHGDQVDLILRHAAGQSSTVSVTLTAPQAATGRVVYFDGEAGRWQLPPAPSDPVAAYQAALSALINAAAQSDRAHPCDVRFGARTVEVLAAAEQSLARGCWVEIGRAVS